MRVLGSFYVQENVKLEKYPQNISPKILAWNTISDVQAEFTLFSVRFFPVKHNKNTTKQHHPPPPIFQHETLQGMNSNRCPKFNLDSCLKMHLTLLKKNRKAGTTKSLEEKEKTAPRAFNAVQLCEAFHRSFLVFAN